MLTIKPIAKILFPFAIAAIPSNAWTQDNLLLSPPPSFETPCRADNPQTPGVWTCSAERGMRLPPNTQIRNSFAILHRATTSQGVLRAVLDLGKRPDFSLFFRAEFPQNIDEVDGYSVSLYRQTVDVHRWEAGFAMPTLPSASIPKNLRRIALRIETVGLHTTIKIFDVSDMDSPLLQLSPGQYESNAPILQLTLDDLTWHGVAMGYRAYKKQDPDTALRLWSFHPYDARPPRAMPANAIHPDAYARQHRHSYVIVPKKTPKSSDDAAARIQNACAHVRPSIFPHAKIYRCDHNTMTALVAGSTDNTLPPGLFWTEPRAGFAHSEYRKFAKELACRRPMHCRLSEPLDPNKTAKDADMVQAYLDAYAQTCASRFKRVRLENLGSTYLGHPMRALVLSNAKPDRPVVRVLINGSHHGMELLAADFAFDVLEQMCETSDDAKRDRYASWLDHVELWVLPVVNLDGLDMYFHISDHLGRKNGRGVFAANPRPQLPAQSFPERYRYGDASCAARYRPNAVNVGAGVDINRNYPLRWGATGELSSSNRPRNYWYRGAAPASEPETQSMMNAFHREQFAASMSYHTVSTRILSPYSIDALQNPPHDDDPLWQLALEMSKNSGVQPNGRPYEVVKNIYSVDGTDQDWFRFLSGTYAFLVEGPLHNPTGKRRRQAIETTRPTWETLIASAQTATIVRVRSTSGEPLVAKVEYDDIPLLNREIWLTRPEDGTHTMICTNNRTIAVTLANGMKKIQNAECKKGEATLVDFTFDLSSESLPSAFESLCHFGFCDTPMFGVDAYCDIAAGKTPRYPAQRYCVMGKRCLPAGASFHFGPLGTWTCNPREQSRYEDIL